ncbi:MAG: hypothetical protein V9E99_10380 [Microthrixaceae bacterium]
MSWPSCSRRRSSTRTPRGSSPAGSAREYTLLTRPERLRTVAEDLVAHFVGRGFTGKAMYVGLDKAAAVRMYDYVQEAWAEHLAELRAQHDALPELERPWLASRIELMESTDMAVVVSQSQNEIAHLERHGLDIRPHRRADERRGPRRAVQGPR